MNKLSFSTKKLGEFIERINIRAKNVKEKSKNCSVFGVSNTEGITITGKKTSKNLDNYIYVEGEAFIYNPYRINVGSIGLTDKSFKGLVSPAYVVFRTKEDLSSNFLFYFLKNPIGINLIKWYGDRGGVRNALGYKDLEKIDIPNLDTKQQKLFLDKIKGIDQKRNSFDLEIGFELKLLKNLRQSILSQAVSGKLVKQDPKDEPASKLLEKIKKEKENLIKEGKLKKQKPLSPIQENEIPFQIPKNWEWVRLGEISEKIHYGFTASADFNSNKIKLVRITDIQDDKIKWDYLPSCKISKEEYKKYALEKNDILIARTGGTIGKSCLIDDVIFQSVFASYLIRVIPIVFVNCDYIKILLNSNLYWEQLYEKSMGTGQPNVNSVSLSNLKFPLPPIQEQKRIVKKVDGLMKMCDELEKNLNQTKNQSQNLMLSVLQEAFKS